MESLGWTSYMAVAIHMSFKMKPAIIMGTDQLVRLYSLKPVTLS